jgi:NADPH:quinone reductase
MAERWIAPGFGGPEVLRRTTFDPAPPGLGDVTIEVRAVGLNPADYKIFASGDPARLPMPVGFEVAGVISAIGRDTQIASGGGAVGDAVLAFRVSGGYATALTVPAKDVFAKPPMLGWAEAANLLLAGTTAAEMLHVTGARAEETIVVHGASGAVGVSVLQQAGQLGVRAVGTASESRFDVVREFGGVPVAYGEGLQERLRAAAPGGYAAALDTVGTDEAVDTSLALVADRERIVTIAAFGRAEGAGIQAIGGSMPASAAFRDSARAGLIDLAGAGELVVPIARTFPFAEAPAALELLRTGHPGGKLALLT